MRLKKPASAAILRLRPVRLFASEDSSISAQKTEVSHRVKTPCARKQFDRVEVRLVSADPTEEREMAGTHRNHRARPPRMTEMARRMWPAEQDHRDD